MIVRIMNEGQYTLDAEGAGALEQLEHQLDAAIEAGDEASFAAVLEEAVEAVRHKGTPVDGDTLVPSDLTLPHPHSTLAEVRELLSSDESQEA